MKVLAWLGAAAFAVGSAFACSSTPERPPIQTTGTSGVSPGGAGGAAGSSSGAGANDAGTAVTEDGGSVVDGGVCNSTNCGGCCTAVNQCENGTTNAACGVSGGICQACASGFNCTNGQCF